MIPDWRRAINNALRILRPGGLIGVVDFRVSRRNPPPGFARHGAFTRHFWPRWFGHDGVHLDAEHLHALAARTEPVLCEERMAAVPYLPGLRAPYYLYIGRKSGRDAGRRAGQVLEQAADPVEAAARGPDPDRHPGPVHLVRAVAAAAGRAGALDRSGHRCSTSAPRR